ncbi:MAG: S46 family peptidase [Terriglobales bacterium]
MRCWLLTGCVVLCLATLGVADEGMWLFNVPPTAKVKATYGFTLTEPWLDHVRLSSVRFNNGGSGSFVSANGLTFTNHHVGATCIHELSTGGKDFMKTGFYAKTQAEEAKCPDLELNVLQGIEDVTGKVNAAIKPGMSVAEQGVATRAAMSAIEKDCTTATKLRCDVVTLYSGAMYHLYKYKKYTDVRLVFAPEFSAAFFGGDPDNFEFPRYDLDISYFRIYENDKPVHLDNYLKWSTAGVRDGELIFVSGNPGSTGRLNTMAQLEFLRDTGYPLVLHSLRERAQVLKKFSAESAENARIAQEDLFSFENSLKAITGYQSGLLDKGLMAKKADEENKLKQAVESDPQKKAEFGDPWAEIAKAMETQKQIYLPLTYLERRRGLGGELAGIARTLVRVTEERTKPNGERLREYRDSNLPSLEQQLFSPAPIYKSLETVLLTQSLTEMKDKMPDSPLVKELLSGKTPAGLAKSLIDNTRLQDVAVRKQLYEGGVAAVKASTDPLIVLMRDIDPEARTVRKQYDDEVDAVVRRDGGAIAKIRFAAEGTNMYPDATFTLRLSYGAIRGYVEDGRGIVPKGTRLPYFTIMGGAYEHAARHGNKPPYDLPPSWMNSKPKVNLRTPLNVVQTADIIGGNSGSPVINTAGEVVGIIFDGNIQSLPWNFVYEDVVGRSIHVDSRGILEALRNIYHANALADELVGKTGTVTRKKDGKKAPTKKGEVKK